VGALVKGWLGGPRDAVDPSLGCGVGSRRRQYAYELVRGITLPGSRSRQAEEPEAIKSPATTLTLGTAAGATIATLIAAFNDSFEAVFGQTAGPDIKAAVLIAVIVAWALTAIADMFARAIAKAATERARGAELAAKASAAVVLMPTALSVTRLKGPDEPGFLAVALRDGDDGDGLVMLAKEGRPPEWVERDEVEFAN